MPRECLDATPFGAPYCNVCPALTAAMGKETRVAGRHCRQCLSGPEGEYVKARALRTDLTNCGGCKDKLLAAMRGQIPQAQTERT